MFDFPQSHIILNGKGKMFDFINFLDDFDIHYETVGKNISAGWIGIRCPFCDDPSSHLGLELGGEQRINCLRCGGKSLINIITELIPDHRWLKILKQYSTNTIDIQEVFKGKEGRGEEVPECKLPEECFQLMTRHRKYLIDRGFNSIQLEREWNIKGTSTIGNYKFRIIIPIYYENKLVSFQGRDITGRQKDKYKTCYGTTIKNYLYGMDYVTKDKIIVAEGVTDVWRLGKGNAVATFGIEFTRRQLNILVKRKFRKIGILFDNEPQAQEQADKLTESLNCFSGMKAIKLKLPKGKDPARLSKKEIEKIFKDFF